LDIRTQKSDPVDAGSGRSRDQAFFVMRRRRAAAPTRPAPARRAGAGTGIAEKVATESDEEVAPLATFCVLEKPVPFQLQ